MRDTTHEPNLQNVSVRTEEARRLRRALGSYQPPSVDADYSELEKRILERVSSR